MVTEGQKISWIMAFEFLSVLRDSVVKSFEEKVCTI